MSPILVVEDVHLDTEQPHPSYGTPAKVWQPKRFKGKVFYPEGLSVAVVSPKGKVPACAGCHRALERDTYPLVKKEVINEDRRWTRRFRSIFRDRA